MRHPDHTSMHSTADDVNFVTNPEFVYVSIEKTVTVVHHKHVNSVIKTRFATIKHDCQQRAIQLFKK